MLTIGITDRRDIPHEPGEWMEFRKLSWKQLQDAREARQEAVFGKVKQMGSEVMGALPKTCRRCGEEKHDGPCPPAEQRADASAADPTNEYDRDTLLHAGIVQWSYEEGVTDATIDELDEPTAAWAHAEIVAYNTVPKGEAQEK